MTTPVITVDGPSGSGKGTVCRRLAEALGFHLLDSGALYRLTGLAGHRAGLAPTDAAGHARLARAMQIEFGAEPDGSERVLLDGEAVTQLIRTEQAGDRASRVASFPAVREALIARQRGFATPPGLIADGRDMGTVIFPAAALKIFLTASAEERARRRYKQLKDKGLSVSLTDLSREIAERDHRDASRALAPLVAAADAVSLDSTQWTPDEVVAHVLELARQRL